MGNRYDIAIIGGGIHGVGVAQAAAAAGYKTVLLEERHIAAGTSSRSSKLIHGGLRYLETFQFSLVREALRERRILLQNAPSLVHMLPFYLPVYRGQSRSTPKILAGLICYSLLGGLHQSTGFRFVPQNQWQTLDGINKKGLVAVFEYQEAQTDDNLLTRAVMVSAQRMGATLLCPAAFASMENRGDHVFVGYKKNDQEKNLAASIVINAAGPWLNEVLARTTPKVPLPPIDLVQGSHIVMKGLLQKGAYFVEHPHDRRMVLIMPWKDAILIGTTEIVFQGNPDQVKPLPEETNYLQDMASRVFPSLDTTIINSFAGIRVLPAGEKNIFHRSRETVLHQDRSLPRLISIYGGKLTTYRATAQKVIQMVEKMLPYRQRLADTKKLPLLLEDSRNVLI